MKGKSLLLHAVLLACLLAPTLVSAQNADEKVYEGNKSKIEEWKNDRFGMFIHWGPVTLTGKEISWSRGTQTPIAEYDQLYKRFNPVNFDPDAWVSLAKAAGMRYIVLTTKHHDGFCLWPSRQTDHQIMNTPYQQDVVKKLSDACRKQGIKFGAYYSTCDWYNPDFPLTSPGGSVKREKSNLDAYTSYLKRQVAELLVNYGPLYVLWFDVPQAFDKQRGQGVLDFIRAMQPDIIANNRTGAPGDFDTPEQHVGNYNDARPWETCMTIADQWAWKPNDKVKTLEQCIDALLRSVGGDGNFLFNVGPKSDGTIEPEQIARLKEIGQWMDENGQTVYGTRGGPFKPASWGVSTRKGDKIYVHVMKWNKGDLVLPDLGVAVKSACLYGGKRVSVKSKNGQLTIKLSPKDMKPIDTIVEMTMAQDVMTIPAVSVPETATQK
jgi:alpha-L-fucosidase